MDFTQSEGPVTIFQMKGERLYKCDLGSCSFSSADANNLAMHMKRDLKRHNLYSCEQCSYQGNQRSSLRTHIRSVHENWWHYCDQCAYKANQMTHLKMHKQTKHEGVIYSCDQCDHKVPSKYRLKFHVESVHDGIKFNCDQCNYTAPSKGSLNVSGETLL